MMRMAIKAHLLRCPPRHSLRRTAQYVSLGLVWRLASETFLAILLVFLSGAVFAGDLAQKVQEAYRNTPALEANFVQKTYVEILEKEVIEKGTLLLAKPGLPAGGQGLPAGKAGRFKISYEGKRERAYISDGKRLWIIHPGEKEVIDDIRSQVSPETLTFLGGLGEMERDFQVTEESSGKRGKLILTPRREDSPFKKIVLTIDPKSNLACEAELFPKNGNRSLYRFEKMTVKNDVPSDLFHP